MYLSFDFINISYLLYLSESALLSAFLLTFSSLSVQLERGSFTFSFRLSYLSSVRDLTLWVFLPGQE